MSEYEFESVESGKAYVAPPGSIVGLSQTETTITVTWIYAPGGGQTGTRLRWEVENVPVGEFDVSIGMVRYEIVALMPNNQYRIRAFGLKGDEVSVSSVSVLATTAPAISKPASPTNLVATPTKDSMALTWSGPANASSYTVSYGLAPNGAEIKAEITSNTHYTFSSLGSDTHYYFDVCSSNNNGDSAPTRVVKRTLQVPVPPANLRATSAITTMDVEWSVSVGAVDYVIRYGVEPGGATNTLTTRLLKLPLVNLIKNTLYFVQVNARNINGESLPSRITQKTLDGPALPPKPGSLAIVTTHDVLTVFWGLHSLPHTPLPSDWKINRVKCSISNLHRT